MSRGVADLVAITDTVLDAELAQLRKLSAEADAIRAAIAQLQQEKAAYYSADTSLSGGGDRWLVWAARRNLALNVALATAMANREQQKKRAERAFGRAEATKALAVRDQKTRRILTMRRGVSF